MFASGQSDFHLKDVLKKLFSSIPFDVYLLIFIMAIFQLNFHHIFFLWQQLLAQEIAFSHDDDWFNA